MKAYTSWYDGKKLAVRQETYYEARRAAARYFRDKFFPEKTWSEIFSSRELRVKQGVYR